MIYRVSILAHSKTKTYKLSANILGRQMRELGLKAPSLSSGLGAGRFWFTDHGYNQIGRKLRIPSNIGDMYHFSDPIQRFELSWEKQKNPRRSQIQYSDKYQVRILPNKRGQK